MRSKFFYVLVSLALAPCAYSQVGIGTIAPDNSAQLEVKANNRGVLIPRIALKSITQQLSSAKNAKSLLIFNSKEFKDPNDSVTYSEGYYYWDGERWVRLLRGDDLSGALGNVTLQGDVTGPLNNTKVDNFINKPVDSDANPEANQVLIFKNGKWTPSKINSSSLEGQDLTAGDNSIEVTDGTGATLVNTNVKVADGGITNDKLANDAVTSDKIKNGTIKGEDLDANAVTSKNIKGKDGVDGEVLVTKADGTTEWKKLSGDNITGKNLTLGKGLEKTEGNLEGALLKAVTIGISDKGVDPTKIKPSETEGQVLVTKEEGGEKVTKWETPAAPSASDLKNKATLTTQDGIVVVSNSNGTTADNALLTAATIGISDNGITTEKIKAGANGQILTTNDQGKVVWENLEKTTVDNLAGGKNLTAGDASIEVTDGTGATLVNTNVKVADGGITNDKLAGGITSSKITGEDLTLETGLEKTSGDLAGSLLKAVTIGISNNGITNDKLAGGIAPGKILQGANGQVLVTKDGTAKWETPEATTASNIEGKQDLTAGNGLTGGTTTGAVLAAVNLSVKPDEAKGIQVTNTGVGINKGDGIDFAANKVKVKANSAKAVEVTDAGVGVKTGNGITLDATAGVELGGVLTKASSITTDTDKALVVTAASEGKNTIKFEKLPTESTENFNFVTVDNNGQLKKVAPKATTASNIEGKQDLTAGNGLTGGTTTGAVLAAVNLSVKPDEAKGIQVTNTGVGINKGDGIDFAANKVKVKANSAKAVEVTDAGVGVKTGNGITLDATAGVELGGVLTKASSITTDTDKALVVTAASEGKNTIKFEKLPTESTENFNFVTVGAYGQLKKGELAPYSSEEKYTGRKWTVGEAKAKVYQQTIEVTFSDSTNAPFTVPTGGTIISATMVNKNEPTDIYSSVRIKDGKIYANTGAMYWTLNGTYYVTIEYYK